MEVIEARLEVSSDESIEVIQPEQQRVSRLSKLADPWGSTDNNKGLDSHTE